MPDDSARLKRWNGFLISIYLLLNQVHDESQRFRKTTSCSTTPYPHYDRYALDWETQGEMHRYSSKSNMQPSYSIDGLTTNRFNDPDTYTLQFLMFILYMINEVSVRNTSSNWWYSLSSIERLRLARLKVESTSNATVVWGGFSVNNATLNRFYSLHFVLPFVLAALAAIHLLTIHEHGSGNPLGISGNTDRIPFHPYFTFKDLVTIFAFLLGLSAIVFYMPNILGHSDNYIPANPMQTPPSIVPEWYLLPFYAILRSIPNKLFGVIAIFSALLILLAMPLLDTSRIRGSQFRPLMRFAFWVFVADFIMLMYLGACHVEDPFIEVGQFCTALYFAWFLVIVPAVGIVENTLLDLATSKESLPFS